MKFKISLVLTSTLDRNDDLMRFLNSLTNQTTPYPINLYFVYQESHTPFYPWDSAGFKSLISNSGRISLSAARNIALSQLSSIDDTCEIIGFPDDDCWYSVDLLDRIIEYFENNPSCNVLCTGVFDPQINKSYGNRPLDVKGRVSFYNLFKLPISVGIFIRRDIFFDKQLFFDEMLGAGTKLASGEETELVSRLLESGCRIDYYGGIMVYHPVPSYSFSDVSKFYNYSLGFGYLITKLLRRGHVLVVFYFIEIFTRSLVGVLFNLLNPINRKIYWGRLKGMGRGTLISLTNRFQNY